MESFNHAGIVKRKVIKLLKLLRLNLGLVNCLDKEGAMNQEQMKQQEEKVVEFIQNTIPVFKYDKLKVKHLKKYDGEQLSQEIMDDLKECLMSSIEYKTVTKTKEVE